MQRIPWLLLLAGLASACITTSKSLGQADEGSSGSDDASSTGGDGQCELTEQFSCTAPYPLTFGECGGMDFDESCCMRPSCGDHGDCGAGEACVPEGVSGLSCADVEVDGALECQCSADASGNHRKVCLPHALVPTDWCANYFDQDQCERAAGEHEFGENDIQFCRWIEVQRLTIEGDACVVDEPEGRCLTIQQGFDPGCATDECSVGEPEIVLGGPQARAVSDGSFEVFGVADVFCGSGIPLGDWVHGSDASLGACAMTCGVVGPCAQPFPEYVDERAQASADAPVDDCGAVTLDDPPSAWQEAHDCALAHATAGEGFVVIAQQEGIDSDVHHAFIGLQAESYAVVELHSDVGAGFASLYELDGTGIAALEDCVVAVGNLCLTTIGAGEPIEVCST